MPLDFKLGHYPTAGRDGHATRSLDHGSGTRLLIGYRSGDGAQRPINLDPLALLLSKFMRQSFHEYAGESVKHSFWARAYYEQQIAKGKRRQAAVRALAYKWIRIILEVLADSHAL